MKFNIIKLLNTEEYRDRLINITIFLIIITNIFQTSGSLGSIISNILLSFLIALFIF